MARDNTHALSFGLAVDDYERGRPSYPAAAVDWMLAQSSPNEPPSAADLVIVDVGAGTGKFTASFAERGLNVTAVEPDSAMRARFSARFPHVEALEGTGESLPLPDTSVDLVTFAQAWHWVDVEAASAEIARVLKPGGTLGLIWNIRDDSVEWVRQLGEIMGASAAEEYETLTPPVGASLERVAHADFF
ncbi:class I SAM-dependent methyltransferase [Subtercola sp. RTI3]|nr:class I SAM-dependent methyltransferase [Subtercola sp. RTI3]MEA9983982.1 class I SAM-dependent methyltransferase [Subtercola sp. RTI3]